MGGQRRRRLDTRSWREVMLRFGEAGTTVSAFCAREGLSTSSFYRWRERLGSAGGAGGAAPRPGGRSELAVRPTAAGFIDLGHLTVRISAIVDARFSLIVDDETASSRVHRGGAQALGLNVPRPSTISLKRQPARGVPGPALGLD